MSCGSDGVMTKNNFQVVLRSEVRETERSEFSQPFCGEYQFRIHIS